MAATLGGMPAWTAAGQLRLYDQLGYVRPEPAQDRFLTDWAHRVQVVIAPARSSKSYTAAKKALPVVLGRQVDRSGPQATMTWIVGPTYELAQKEFRYLVEDLTEHLPKQGWPSPLKVRDNANGGDLYIQMPWGSEVYGKSADRPRGLLGEAVDCVIMAEAAQIARGGQVWERYVEPRLSTTKGFAIFPTTPDAGAQWLYDLDLQGQQPNGRVASYTWPVTGNPTYDVQELADKRAFYGEGHPVFQEQYLGRWAFYGGTVYGDDFDRARNVIPRYAPPPTWRRIRAIDWGFRDPFVCTWYVVTSDGGLDCYRELYVKGKSTEWLAAEVRRRTGDEAIWYTTADDSEPALIQEFTRRGIPCLEAKRERRAGRMQMADYLRLGKLRFMEGCCPDTLRELSWYRWDEVALKEGIKEKTVGEDHAMDAHRYACMSRPRATPAPIAAAPPGSMVRELHAVRAARLASRWPHAARSPVAAFR